jgi:putative transposase
VSFSGKHRSLGVKASIIVDGTGIPLGVNIAPGSWNDMKLAINTIEDMRLEVPLFGSYLLADKGYDSFKFRKYLDWKGLRSNIPKRSTTLGLEKELYNCDPKLSKLRFIIERTNAWFKSFKRLRFRYDRTSYSFEAFLYLAILVICVRRLVP